MKFHLEPELEERARAECEEAIQSWPPEAAAIAMSKEMVLRLMVSAWQRGVSYEREVSKKYDELVPIKLDG